SMKNVYGCTRCATPIRIAQEAACHGWRCSQKRWNSASGSTHAKLASPYAPMPTHHTQCENESKNQNSDAIAAHNKLDHTRKPNRRAAQNSASGHSRCPSRMKLLNASPRETPSRVSAYVHNSQPLLSASKIVPSG